MKAVNTIMGVMLAMFFAYSTGGCPPTQPPQPLPNDASDASVLPTLSDAGDEPDPLADAMSNPTCVKACKALTALGCPEALTPDGGKTCYRLCVDAEKGNTPLNADCVAKSTSVSGVRLCGTVRCKGK